MEAKQKENITYWKRNKGKNVDFVSLRSETKKIEAERSEKLLKAKQCEKTLF
jgi:hypothetical protein